MLDFVLDFLFPPVCVICGKLDKMWICPKCKKRIEKYEKFKLVSKKEDINSLFNYLINDKTRENYFIKEKMIKTKEMPKIKESFKIKENHKVKEMAKIIVNYEINNRIEKVEVNDCNEKIFFDEFFYAFEYKGIIRNLILKYKFTDASYLSYFFSNMILNNKKINEILKNYDIMIPVPMDKNKKSQRGYNQTELITKNIEKNIITKTQLINKKRINNNKNKNKFEKCNDKIKYENNTIKKYILIDNNCLVKSKTTQTQSTLSAKERLQNIKNAFGVKNVEKIKNKKIILFDDIITTGATVNEISKILKIAGAKKVLVLVIAKD